MASVRRRLIGFVNGVLGPTADRPSFAAIATAFAGPICVLLFRLTLERFLPAASPMLVLYVAPIAGAAFLDWRAGLLATIVSSAAGGYYLLSHSASQVTASFALSWVPLVVVGLIVTALLERLHRRLWPLTSSDSNSIHEGLPPSLRSGLAVAVVLLVIISAGSYASVDWLRNNTVRANATLQFVRTLRSLSAAISDLRSVSTTYALTGDQPLLDDAQRSRALLDARLALIRRAAAGIVEHSDTARLNTAVEQFIESVTPVTARSIADTDPVRLRADLEATLQADRAVQSVLSELEGVATQQYLRSDQTERRGTQLAEAGILAGSATALIVVVVSFIGISRDFSGRRQAEAALRAMNETLESRSAARASQLIEANLALRQQELRNRSFFDNMLETVLHGRVVFEQAVPVDVEILAVNRSFIATMGMGDPTGRRLNDVIPGFTDQSRGLFDDMVRVTVTGVPMQREYWSARIERWMDVSIFRLNEGEFAILSQDISARKQVDETRSLLARIVESSDDAIVAMNLEGIVTSWNASAERVFGYTAAEALGVQLTALITPENRRDEGADIVARLVRGESVRHVETVRRTKDGSLINVSLSASPLLDASNRISGIAGIVRDVTEELQSKHKQSVRAARHELQRSVSAAFAAAASSDLHALLTVIAEETVEYLSDGCVIWVIDNDGVLRQLAAAARNRQIEERCRRSPLDMPIDSTAPPAKVVRSGSPLLLQATELEQYLSDLPDAMRPLFAELDIRSLILAPMRVGAETVGALALRLESGKQPFTDEDLAFAVDLAERAALAVRNARLQEHVDAELRERLKAEERAREEERRFLQVVENIDEVFWMTDVSKRQVFYVSPAYKRMWLRDPANAADPETGWVAAIHPEDRPRVMESVDKQVTGDYDETYRIIRPDGAIRWIRDRAFPVSDESGAVVRIAGLAEDITERRRLELQFQQAQKMEAVGQLASGIAHDFNNLLTAIHGFASLALRALDPNPLEEELTEIHRASTRAAELTKQLLLFSRRQTLQPVAADLNEVVESVTRMLRRLIGSQVSLQLDLTPGLPRVDADQGMLEQVLVNLAVNARDAMPDGGQLTIATAVEQLDASTLSAFPGLAAGPTVVLTVKDTGTGITPDALPHIFEPFFTTKEVGKGSGLGLASVYGIVKQHNGWISATSTRGEGAVFTIRLPASRTVTAAPTGGSATHEQSVGAGTVLVAEDDPSIRSLTTRVLRNAGFTVLAAASGVEALELWRNADRPVHLLLTDIVMPDGVNGLELARRLREDCPQLKVIYSTGYSSDLHKGPQVLREGVRILQKPYGLDALLRAVHEMLDSPEHVNAEAPVVESRS